MIRRCLIKATSDKKYGAIYLHVIMHNSSAMRLYERMEFVNLRRLSNYYRIDGKESMIMTMATMIITMTTAESNDGTTTTTTMTTPKTSTDGNDDVDGRNEDDEDNFY